MKKYLLFSVLSFLLVVVSCKKNPEITEEPIDTGFVKGADIGWLQQMEATGYQFYTKDFLEKYNAKMIKLNESNIETIME